MLASYQPQQKRENPVADLSLMRNLYREGVVVSAFASPAETGKGWVLTCVRHNGTHERMHIAKSTRIKVYKTLCALHLDAQRIGFDSVTIEARQLNVA
jgi:hypothetical protein